MNLIKMIRCVVHNAPCEALTDPNYEEISSIARSHKLSAFLFESLPFLPAEQRPNPEIQTQWKRLYRSLLVVEANQRYEFERLIDAFDNAGISTLPVKGFAAADLYPRSVLRSMSDLDILYDETKQENAACLMQELGYRAESVGNGNTDQFFSDMGIHVEMHRSLYEDRMPEAAKPYLESFFDFAESGRNCHYALFQADSYLYLILHTYKHFIFAGTGIRSVLDVYFCKDLPMDREYLLSKCRLFGIEKFLLELERLSEVWFSDAEASTLSEQLGTYIADGGVYGSEENKLRSEMRRAEGGRRDGKLKYVLRRFFLPYRSMKNEYHVLQRLPFLLPLLWIYRAFFALLHRRKKLTNEIHNLSNYDKDHAASISELMNALEIH